MPSGTYRYSASYKQPLLFGRVGLPTILRWTPTLGVWGGAALVGVLYMADSIPIYRHSILQKLPVIGSYYDDTVDPEDTPF